MLQLSKSILNRPVLSLRSGGPVATTVGAVINPNNLKIEGLYCQDAEDRKKTLILLYQDIRDVLPQGLAVDDHDVLAEPSELVRLKSLINLRFQMLGKHVVTDSGQRMGKVVDYAVEVETMYIQKIYVAQSVFKNLAGGNLGVDRSQIIEISDKKIVIQDPLQGVPANVPA